MEKNLIIKSKSINMNNREKKKNKINYKNIIVKRGEKIRRNKIKAYFYKKIK